MKVLVTGGAGFIGSHIVDVFLENGWEVHAADNLSSGKPENVNPAASLTKIDICAPEMRDYIIGLKPELIIHAAAQISVSRSVREPAFDSHQNITGPLDMLMAALEAGVKKVVFSSSGGTVYGEVPEGAASETYGFNPLSPYGISKMAFEYYLEFFRSEHGLKYTALRYGNVFGPRQDPHGEAGVVAIFAKLLLAGKTPTINGDGLFYRDYVYCRDVARANLIAATAGDNRAFNIGTGVGTDVNVIFKTLADAIGFKGEAKYGPPRAGDLRRCVLDCVRAEAELGWKPEFTLASGMAPTVEFFKRSE